MWGLVVFLLVAAYALGARGVVAQVNPGEVVALTGNGGVLAATQAGEVYYSPDFGVTWVRRSNVFNGGATQANSETWGRVKVRYRGAAPEGK